MRMSLTTHSVLKLCANWRLTTGGVTGRGWLPGLNTLMQLLWHKLSFERLPLTSRDVEDHAHVSRCHNLYQPDSFHSGDHFLILLRATGKKYNININLAAGL